MRKANQTFHHRVEPFQPALKVEEIGAEDKASLLRATRWWILLAYALLLFPAYSSGYLLQESVPYYMAIVGVLAGYNLFARRLGAYLPLMLQLSLDLAGLCTLLTICAGCHNPFSSLIFVAAIVGPIFLPRAQAWIYLVEAAVGMVIVCHFTEPVLHNAAGEVVSPFFTMSAKILVLFMLGSMTLWLKKSLDAALDRSQRLAKQKQRMNNFRAIGVLAGQLSHELSTPMNTMKLALDRMGRDASLKDIPELLRARAALKQCEGTVRELFDYGVDAESLSFKETTIAQFVHSICMKWSLDYPEAQLTFDIGSDVESCRCHIPATPFAHTILDLLDNAMEASSRSRVEITVALRSQGQTLDISILDRGSGLDAAIKGRIGEPFVSTKSTGTGLGIYNATALLEALGGRFGLYPRLGGGTEALMVLPL